MEFMADVPLLSEIRFYASFNLTSINSFLNILPSPPVIYSGKTDSVPLNLSWPERDVFIFMNILDVFFYILKKL